MKAVWQRVNPPDAVAGEDFTYKVRGWNWWKLVTIAFNVNNAAEITAAELAVKIKTPQGDMIGLGCCPAAIGIQVAASSSVDTCAAVNLPPGNGANWLAFGLPDATQDVDADIIITFNGGGVTTQIRNVWITIEGIRVGDMLAGAERGKAG